MITCDLWAGLGNQLFMMATTIAHATRMGTTFAFPQHTLDDRLWRRKMPHLPTIPSGLHLNQYKENDFRYHQIPKKDNIRLSGYFQSEKYFADCRGKIIKEFDLQCKAQIDAVAVHVRRGDYLLYPDKHPVITKEYILNAIGQFYYGTNFIFFSDDIIWCQKQFAGHTHCYFNETNDEITDLKGMIACRDIIIANSSYSWWAAWLNPNPAKVVVAPKLWFGPGNKHLNTTDLIPQEWILL